MHVLPTLYKKTSTGAIEQWSIESEGHATTEGTIGHIITRFGQVEGKLQTGEDWIKSGKNVGKKNETTPLQQAELEAEATWVKKKKKGYVETISQAREGTVDEQVILGGIEPMLAQSYNKHASKIKFPAYVQPKLDGHRCIAIVKNGKCTLWSRTRKQITSVPHIVEQIEHIFKDIVLDGELYNHEYRDKFEQLTSFIRQETPKPGHEIVQYHIYDKADEIGAFTGRISVLQLYALDGAFDHTSLQLVRTPIVTNEDEMFSYFQDFLEQGYEGLIVRNTNGMYVNKRSYDLQKVKNMQDAEFEVVGVEAGRGKMSDKAIFVCKTQNGSTFNAKMKGKLDSLKKYLTSPELAVGRMLTIQFQDYSADGIPRFPVGLRFREDI